MLAIRLARFGKKKQPNYRLIVLDKAKDNFGPYLENLGTYNSKTKIADLKKDRILSWIKKGAKLTPTVNNLLIDQNIISGKKVRASGGKKSAQSAAPASGKGSASGEKSAPAEKPEEKKLADAAAKAETAKAPAKESEPKVPMQDRDPDSNVGKTPKKETPAEKPTAETNPAEKSAEQPKK